MNDSPCPPICQKGIMNRETRKERKQNFKEVRNREGRLLASNENNLLFFDKIEKTLEIRKTLAF